MVGFFTDKGNIRELNEDYLAYSLEDEYELYVIADGMGGHNAGEVASKFAVEGVIAFIKENYGIIPVENLLKESLIDVNTKIYNMSLERKTLSGMGTTIATILVHKDFVQIANVGDSCCFGMTNTKIEKLTKDHSLVQELLDSGCITSEEAKNHPRKNIITRAIGTNKNVDVDIFNFNRQDYDLFLLCTDGLTNDVEETEIWSEYKQQKNLNIACENLVKLVKSRGGKDNITVLVFGGEN
ncbi:Stp1/IreP family PP2C-type Ser/Thr phosphatase [Clostridium tarantellae]|uniref:Stp1/IreP family PP2C-type Ser/Thr phosphatase n=1 Tax=Clostridium tarantellae TaxID=39493 RepID=A0A6I1MJ66_9CLOT|nr:Stp1/IreP family PP2C-type Ser/Thr phosphatase [Clostridium tarantellae]MPQ42448.1 Stp1/IreP family PP2C-type Ser/Thr phosphatase [Clostridium tarantellae]